MGNFIPNPPTVPEINLEVEHIERSLHVLVENDDNYEEVAARLENPNERNAKGDTLLHVAARSYEENSRILQLLLDKGADVDSTIIHKWTPLHFAVGFRKRNAVAALIEAGASINSKSDAGMTALHLAVSAHWFFPGTSNPNAGFDMWILERLLCHPEIDVNPVYMTGGTPLMYAVRGGNSDAVQALLKKGADPNIPNMNNRTPFHLALSATNPSESIICALLYKEVGIYCEDWSRRTPMDFFVGNEFERKTAQHVLWYIALRYKVTRSLVRKLEEIPDLHKYFKKCLRQVRRMKRRIVYGNFTLHDFACDCFPLQVNDPLEDIYEPVVRILTSGSYREYLDFILKRMTTRDLIRVMKKITGVSGIEGLCEKSLHLLIFWTYKAVNVRNIE